MITRLIIRVTGIIFVSLVLFTFINYKERGVPFVGKRNFYSVSVFELADPAELSMKLIPRRATLSRKSEHERGDVRIVADPFLFVKDDVKYIFFEILDDDVGRGEIAVAHQNSDDSWTESEVVISEPFHMSYPYVFEEAGVIFMVPESNDAETVRLYKALDFPGEWQLVSELIRGHFVDPTLIKIDETWWLFVGRPGSGRLDLFYADSLTGNWLSHPMNPIVNDDAKSGRPGGRLFMWPDGRLVRPAQIGVPHYAAGLNFFEIVSISKDNYQERLLTPSPVLNGDGNGWNSDGMHHVDFVYHQQTWWAAVDGLEFKTVFGWDY